MTTVLHDFITNATFDISSDPNIAYLLPYLNRPGVTSIGFSCNAAPGGVGGTFAGGGGDAITGLIPFNSGLALTITMGYHAGGAGNAGGHASGAGGGSTAGLIGGTLHVEAGGGAGSGGFGTNTSSPTQLGGLGGAGGLPGNAGNTGNGVGGVGGHGANGADGAAGGNGSAGSSGVGGAGGAGGPNGFGAIGGSGGGGGGGHFGGGGGGGITTYGGGGGGGGGQSYVSPSVLNPVFNTGTSGAAQFVVVYTYADAPDVPVLLAPAFNSFLDAFADGVTFKFTPTPGHDSGLMNAYCLRVKQGAGTQQYWNATSGALQNAQVWNTCAPTVRTVTIPPGIIADGHLYTWSIATQEAYYNRQGGFANVFGSDFSFTASVAPTVAITAPPAICPFPSPTCSWTETLGGGLSQVTYRVIYYTIADTQAPGFVPGVTVPSSGFDTGVVTSAATSATCPFVLVNGAGYVAYVQITETGGIPSIWTSRPFITAIYPPATPLLQVRNIRELVTKCPQTQFDLTQFDNMLNTNDADVLVGPLTWTFSNCIPQIASSNLGQGLNWLLLTATGGATMTGHTNERIPAVPGDKVYAMTTFNLPATMTAKAFQLQVFFYDGSNTLIGSPVTVATVTDAGGFGTAATGTATAPANTASFDIGFATTTTVVASQTHALVNIGAWLNHTPAAWSGGGYDDGVTYSVQYSADQINWQSVRGGATSTFAFSESPLNELIYFRAQEKGTLLNSQIAGPWSSVIATQLDSPQWWLLDPLNQNPDANGQPWAMPLSRVASGNTVSPPSGISVTVEFDEEEQQGSFHAFGRKDSIVVRGDLYDAEFDLGLYFDNSDQWDAFHALRDRRTVLCLRSDMEANVYYVILGPSMARGIYSTPDRYSRSGPLSQTSVHCFPQPVP